MDLLKHRDVSAVTDDGYFQHTWPVYRCLYCEVDEGNETFILTAGRWYKVATDFVEKVNLSFRNIDKVDLKLPEFDDETEEAYNRRVSSNDPTRLTFLDRKLVMFGGGASRFEFCDLVSSDCDLIHVKRYAGSNVLSHLFNQGVTAGELYVSDAAFRQLVDPLLPTHLRLEDFTQRPNTSNYRVVFAIVSAEKGDSLTLPFFSRLSLRQAVRALRGYGYRVGIAKVSVADTRVKLKRFAKKKKKN